MAGLFLCCLGLFFMALPGVGGKCYWEPRELKEAGFRDFFLDGRKRKQRKNI